MKFVAIIPARYASTRFPGKPLAVLGGKTVIQRVYEQVSCVLDEAYVATDDERILQAVEAFGGRAVMTRADHKSGTDRIQEAMEKITTAGNSSIAGTTAQNGADVIINVQGDEPFIQPSQIETLMHLFDDPATQIGTLGKPFGSMEAVENPNSLAEVTRLPQSSLEKAESLEQLRWLQNGYRIRVGLTDVETVGIDTPEDLKRAEEFLTQQTISNDTAG